MCVARHDAELLPEQATMTLYGGELLPYYLAEETGWSLDVDELRRQTYKVISAHACTCPHMC
jgi:aspartate/methionine/tyrosine aminotransferase